MAVLVVLVASNPPGWELGTAEEKHLKHRGAPKKNKIKSDVYLADDKWGR
jgi:hypothetical protein